MDPADTPTKGSTSRRATSRFTSSHRASSTGGRSSLLSKPPSGPGVSSSHTSTPKRASGSADVPATGVVEDKELEERRNAIAKSLANAGHNLGFDQLLHLLKLNADYATFGTSMRQKISDLVEQAPAVVGGKIYPTRPARHSSEGDPAYEFSNPQTLAEKTLVSCFAPLLEKMIRSSGDGSQIMPRRYKFVDHQNSAVSGTRIKPDGVVYYGQHRSP
ncbi:hypothetical protein H4R23_004070, partial [Coemansia sp. Cherry 401B]